MNTQIDLVKYYWGIGSKKRAHEIRFSSGLNVVSGGCATGKTIIFNEIKRMLIEGKSDANKSDNVIPLKNDKTIVFSEEGSYLFHNPKLIKKLFSEQNVRSSDFPFIVEKFSSYINRILEIKTLYPYTKFFGINNNDDVIFDCVIDPSGSWSIKHKLSGEHLNTLFYALGEQLIMSFALNLALKDLINPQSPLVVDAYFGGLDESLIQGVWAELLLRDEQVIVFATPQVWEYLKVTPTHVLVSDCNNNESSGKSTGARIISNQVSSKGMEKRLDKASMASETERQAEILLPENGGDSLTNTESSIDNDWPERDLAIRVHALLGKATLFGEPEFNRCKDPELYDAIKILSPIFIQEKGNYEMGKTFGRILSAMICDYYEIGVEAKACGHRLMVQRLEKHGEALERSLRVIGARINVSDFARLAQ